MIAEVMIPPIIGVAIRFITSAPACVTGDHMISAPRGCAHAARRYPDDFGAVDDVDLNYFLEIAGLRRRQRVVEHDEIGVVILAQLLQFLDLAFADERADIGLEAL